MTQRKQYIRQIPLYTFIVLADSYGVTTCILIGLWLLTGERLSFIRVFINLLPPLLIPSIIALPIGLWLRKWRPIMLVLPALITFLLLYGTAFVPKQTASEIPNLSVMTYNMHAINTDFEGIAALIRESNADFVTIQEMRPDMFDFLEQTFISIYPYIVVRESRTSTILLSRYPLRESQATRQTYAIADVNGQDIIIQAIHLPVPLGDNFASNARSQRLDTLLEFVTGYNMPQIMLGDFNMTEATGDYRLIVQQFADVYRETRIGLGTTFPNWTGINPDMRGWPSLIRLDYVFI